MENDVEIEIKRICDILGADYDLVVSSCRGKILVMYRSIISEYLRYRKHVSIGSIAKSLRRNHSSVIHYGKVYENEYRYNPKFREKADLVMKTKECDDEQTEESG